MYGYAEERELTKKEVEDFIDTIEYGIKPINNTPPSNEQSKKQDEAKIIIDSGKDDVTTETIVIGSNDKYFAKNNLIKIIGTILSTIIAIIITKSRKIKLVGIIGWLLIIFQIYKCFVSDSLLVTKDKIEILYTVVYFLPAIIGLILLNKSEVNIMNSNTVSDNISNQINVPSNNIVSNNGETDVKEIYKND